MDDTRPTGHVEPTPEVEPVDSLELRVGDPAGAPEPPPPTPIRPDAEGGTAAGGLAERLKPVAAAAEDVAAKALDLSAKGLSRLAGLLEERRQRRDAGGDGR